MEYITLPNTVLAVSRIGFGAEPLGGTDWGNLDEQQALAAVRQAVESGITLFDTADVYGLGRSEELLSQALGAQRHRVVIVTKFGVNWEITDGAQRARTFFDSSPRRVREALENSLRRLRIDCIPLYLIHWPDPRTPVGETIDELRKCQAAGKVRYFGVSNFSIEQLKQAQQIAPIAAIEFQYSLLDRRPEVDLLPFCKQQGIGVLAYGVLGQGLLTGKYDIESQFPAHDRRQRLAHFQGQQLIQNLDKVDRVKRIAEMYAKQPAQLAIRWALDHPDIACAIVGAKTPQQIISGVAALHCELHLNDKLYLEQELSYQTL